MILHKVRGLCERDNITVTALEKKLGFGNGTISAWDRCSPSVKNLKAVADYFGVTVDELLKE